MQDIEVKVRGRLTIEVGLSTNTMALFFIGIDFIHRGTRRRPNGHSDWSMEQGGGAGDVVKCREVCGIS